MSTQQCAHGQLSRSCDLCECAETIAIMREALTTTAGNIRSLMPHEPSGELYPAYRIWLAVVERAISGMRYESHSDESLSG